LSAAAEAIPAYEIFDAHCHWHLNGDHADAVTLARSLSGAAFTSTQPPDWDAAASAAATATATANAETQQRLPGFGLALGLHPWWAHLHPIKTDGTWLEALRSRLDLLPAAIVGEIGLDRVAVPMDDAGVKVGEPDYQNQLDCFNAQLALAAELERPIAMHCVKAYGDVGDIFRARESMPPRVLMHSYGGTVAYLEGLTKMKRWGPRFYFGFSAVVNLRSPKTAVVIKAVPADRLVIESDLVSPESAEADLRTLLAFVAEARGWDVAETARVTRENAERFYGA
jgi:Tat protein secretion system quality control protein TatD with DNase activity